MAFLPFENDIFISYAWLNDEVPPGRAKGWVTEFVERLNYEISQRFDRSGEIKIWRDKGEMGASTFFDDEIKESIEKSALFIALTSRGYLSEESYCSKEIGCFYDKVKNESYKLKIGNRSRLINVLLQNIPPAEWFPQMEGMSGLAFHDATRKDQIGHLLQPGTAPFDKQMTLLVDELETTLRTFKTLTELPSRDTAKQPPGACKVFLAYTEGSLTKKRDRLAEELQGKGVEVVTNIPPPFSAALHEKTVTERLADIGLSIHLFDGTPGNKIDGDPGDTYYKKQFELSLTSGRRQLVCVPKRLKVDERTAHGAFVRELENGSRTPATYRFLRQNRPNLIAQDVLQEIEKLLKERNGNDAKRAALLDIHEKDGDFAPELSKVFFKRKLKLLINPATDEPDEDMDIFDQLRQGISVLIVVLGHVSDLWASRRVNIGLKVAASLKFCGIYVPPVDGSGSPRPIDLRVFQIPRVDFPVAFCYSPQMLAGLLDKYV